MSIDQDVNGFLRLREDFVTTVQAGTSTVYFSTFNNFAANPSNGTPELKLRGAVQQNIERFFKLDSTPNSQFTPIILWYARQTFHLEMPNYGKRKKSHKAGDAKQEVREKMNEAVSVIATPNIMKYFIVTGCLLLLQRIGSGPSGSTRPKG